MLNSKMTMRIYFFKFYEYLLTFCDDWNPEITKILEWSIPILNSDSWLLDSEFQLSLTGCLLNNVYY